MSEHESGSVKRVARLYVDDEVAYIAVEDVSDYPPGHPARHRTGWRAYRLKANGTLIFEPKMGWPGMELPGDWWIAMGFLAELRLEDGGRLSGLWGGGA